MTASARMERIQMAEGPVDRLPASASHDCQMAPDMIGLGGRRGLCVCTGRSGRVLRGLAAGHLTGAGGRGSPAIGNVGPVHERPTSDNCGFAGSGPWRALHPTSLRVTAPAGQGPRHFGKFGNAGYVIRNGLRVFRTPGRFKSYGTLNAGFFVIHHRNSEGDHW